MPECPKLHEKKSTYWRRVRHKPCLMACAGNAPVLALVASPTAQRMEKQENHTKNWNNKERLGGGPCLRRAGSSTRTAFGTL